MLQSFGRQCFADDRLNRTAPSAVKTTLSILVSAALAAAFSSHAFAQTIIIDGNDFVNNHSTRDSSGTYWFNSGSYSATNTGDWTNQANVTHIGIDDGTTLSATGTAANSYGIRLYSTAAGAALAITQTGGNVTATGNNNGWGIYIYSNTGTASYNQTGGNVTATGNNNNSIGIYIYSTNGTASYNQTGGNVTATGNSNGRGIYISTNSTARYNQSGGTLTLMPGSGTAVYIFGNNSTEANFSGSAVLSPGIDFAANQIGQIALTGNNTRTVTISGDATLRPHLINSISQQVGDAAVGGTFISNDADGTDTFAGRISDTLTFDYTYQKNGNDHTLTATRIASVSAVASGAASTNLAAGIEASSAWVLANRNTNAGAAAASSLYSAADMAVTQSELNELLRGSTSWGATRLMRQTIANTDRAQNTLMRGMQPLNRRSLSLAMDAPVVLASASPDFSLNRGASLDSNVWLTPIVSYDTYDGNGSSHSGTDGYTAGIAGGAARNLAFGTVGFGLSYLYSKQQGGGYRSESDNFSFFGGYISNPVSLVGGFAPQFEGAAGYTYSSVDQDRRDFTGKRRSTTPDIHSGRLYLGIAQTIVSDNGALAITPRFGVDYTHMTMDATNEGIGGLRTSGKDMDSLRPRLGADFSYAVTDRLNVTAAAYARYETLDRQVNLDTRFSNTPITWTTEDQNTDRTSAELGLGFTYQYSDTFFVDGRYDLNVGNNYNSHQASVNLNWKF